MLLRPVPVKGGSQILMSEGQEEKQNALLHKCPRCDSMNTKFCYFNNYSRSQPRHFCRACRRYWTEGGTLRSVPIGGNHKSKRRKTTPITDSPVVLAAGDPIPTISSAALEELQGTIIPNFLEQLLQFPPASLKSPAVYTLDGLFDASQLRTSPTFMEDLSGAGLGFVRSGESTLFTEAASSCSSSSHYSFNCQDVVGSCEDGLLGMMDSSKASTGFNEEIELPASYWEFWHDTASYLTDAGGGQAGLPL